MKYLVPSMQTQEQGVSFTKPPLPHSPSTQVPQSQSRATAHRAASLHTPATESWDTRTGHAPATPPRTMFLGKKGYSSLDWSCLPGNSETRAEMLTCSLVIISCLVISTSSLSSTANAG